MKKTEVTDLRYNGVTEPPYERIDKYERANARGQKIAWIMFFVGICWGFNHCFMVFPIQREIRQIETKLSDTTIMRFEGFNESGQMISYPIPRNKPIEKP